MKHPEQGYYFTQQSRRSIHNEYQEGHRGTCRIHRRYHPRRVHQPRQRDHPLQGQDSRPQCAADHPGPRADHSRARAHNSGPQHSGPHQPRVSASACLSCADYPAARPGQRLLWLHQHRLAAHFLGWWLRLHHSGGQHRVCRHEPCCRPGAFRCGPGRTPGCEQCADRRAEQALRSSGRGNRRPGRARGREGQGGRREGCARRCHAG